MPYPTHRVVVRHPETGWMEPLDPATNYADDHPFVRDYPWAFETVENGDQIVDSVSVEQATAEPGQKRARGRAKPSK